MRALWSTQHSRLATQKECLRHISFRVWSESSYQLITFGMVTIMMMLMTFKYSLDGRATCGKWRALKCHVAQL